MVPNDEGLKIISNSCWEDTNKEIILIIAVSVIYCQSKWLKEKNILLILCGDEPIKFWFNLYIIQKCTGWCIKWISSALGNLQAATALSTEGVRARFYCQKGNAYGAEIFLALFLPLEACFSKNTFPDASRMIFNHDFRLLHIIFVSRATLTWVRNSQAISLTALCYSKYLYVLSSARTNGKSSFPHPHLHKEIYALHPFCLITNLRMPIQLCLSCLLFDSFLWSSLIKPTLCHIPAPWGGLDKYLLL